ncbi:MAG TPA: HAD hydrolase-like protein [Candidatus Saccharimonadales bacterium]|nr:HAD hydrolase-like protein [Candidatus Saccharimonadales bacterium]
MRREAVILDFDGTIADAEEVLLRIYKPMAEELGWPKLTKRDYYRLKKGSPREIMRWANIKIWQIPRLLRLGRAEYKKHIKDIRLFDGIPEVLEVLSEDKDVYILSSNDKATVHKILKLNKLKADVRILQGSPLFGKDKALKKFSKTGYIRSRCWMIGDEMRDIQAGKKAGMNTIGVTWGLQSLEGIKKANPGYIAKKPQDIVKFIYNK